MRYLLDTNVISELVKKKPDSRVVDWIDGVDPLDLFISVLTFGEIKKGIERLPDSAKKATLDNWLNHDLTSRFRDRILSIDIEVMIEWGTLCSRMDSIGKPIAAIDSLLAATAINYNCCLCTRNTQDFDNSGVKLFNPWKMNKGE